MRIVQSSVSGAAGMEGQHVESIQEQPAIAIIGLGLIGGSIARRLSAEGCRVIGFDPQEKIISQAVRDGVLETGAVWPIRVETFRFDAEMTDADVWLRLAECPIVFVCTPAPFVAACVRLVRRLAPEAIVTDVASVKKPVMDQIRDSRFVGGHPMAGSEKNGYEHSRASLLENAAYAVCVPENSTLTVPELRMLERVIRMTGATVLEIAADRHDMAVAAVSHLPHVVASALALLAADQADESLSRLAAGGFRDITRIASSSPTLWTAISLESKTKLLPLLDRYIERLEAFRADLQKSDSAGLEKFFFQAAMFRSSLPVDGRGALIAQSTLTVYIKDQPGELGRITTLLGENRINISNIRIRELRTYEGGCLELLLPDSAQAVHAAWLLKEAGYECD